MEKYVEPQVGMKMSEFLAEFDIDWKGIKALSVKQPFASLIAVGAKTIEWRSKPLNYSGPIVICASGSPKITLENGKQLPTGVAVGLVDLLECRPMTKEDLYAAYCEDYECEVSGYAWVLGEAIEIEPVPVKGIVAPWPWAQRGGGDLILHPGWHDDIFPKGK